jgi:hypothetical protein
VTPESIAQEVRILEACAEKLVRGRESREEELHDHLFYSQVKQN